MISAKIVADSINPQGNRLTTFILTFPRIVLSELNTHMMFSRNSASSRAIPFKKMLKSVISNPFIPIAFQKEHSGMQGTEYLDMDKVYTYSEISNELHKFLISAFKDESQEWDEDYKEIDEILTLYVWPLLHDEKNRTIKSWWLRARDLVVAAACILHAMKVSKQICNRLLEPFMWHTVILTTSEEGLENFFKQRCPDYEQMTSYTILNHRSRKNYLKQVGLPDSAEYYKDWTDLQWLQLNKGQAEIHISMLAECMWDEINQSTPR